MRANRLKQLWEDGQPALGGWLTVPSSFSAEVFAHAGFDWVCVDTQHGVIDYQTSVTMLQALSTTDVVPIVRVPWNEPGIIMKTLDAGAYGVIIPMVNSRAEAEAAVGACRYAPDGFRSSGPVRARFYGGEDYLAKANETVLCMTMIETREAIGNLDEILSVPGIDAAYIGPSDLGISLGIAPGYDQDDRSFVDAIQAVLDACDRHGVVPGIHGGTVATARKRVEQGFKFVEMCSDTDALVRTANTDLKAVRGT
ncbi:MAG: 2,4-dihydroxyhept-2-ene-1,7-dioic acid aldolase [Chloroflexi bacterium]|nr:2,4-dihydroxyhept-2-ene-1,7-dioic acid aldolase [Chloroflexota bacterium]